MTRRSPPRAVVLAWLALLLLGVASAQLNPRKASSPFALIHGTVYGPDDSPIYGAQVQIRRADGTKVKGGGDLHSDHQGEFALRVPAGAADYVVRAELKHKKTKLIGGTTVHVNFDERVDTGVHLRE